MDFDGVVPDRVRCESVAGGMMSFFDEIQAKADAMKAARKAQDELRESNANFAYEVMPHIFQLCQSYATRLKEMGFRVDEILPGDSVTFTLRHPDNDGRTLRVIREGEFGFLNVEDGAAGPYAIYGSLNPVYTFTRENWSLADFESRLQELVKTFTDEAPAHGGL